MKAFLLTILLAVEIPVAGFTDNVELSHIDAYTQYYSAEYNVDPDLITAIIDGESEGEIQAFNTNDNGTHDKGLMQINSFNYEWLQEELGVTDFYNPRQNIQCGVFMIADLMTRHEELHEILMCYNMGETRTRELHRKGIYSSKYSQKVVKKYWILKGEK